LGGFIPRFLGDGIQYVRNAATLLEGDAPQDIVVFGSHIGGFSLGLRHGGYPECVDGFSLT
jgi:hypothetical protein